MASEEGKEAFPNKGAETPGSFEYVRSPEKIKVRVSLMVTERDGKFLVGQRLPDNKLYPDRWEFPGGKNKGGETPEACLLREVGEELEVILEEMQVYLEWDYKYPDSNQFHLVAFRCRLVVSLN